ncbi:MAG: DUF2948 family protein [Alphaproteobacteria bacterium]|nr:DUF2948 family protein [Alphaproteobacteria bacterium]
MSLKLRAESPEDVIVIGGYLQDAAIKVADIAWLPTARRFALVGNRFMWEREGPPHFRTRAGLHFETVTAARIRGISQDQEDQVLELLTIHAVERDGRALVTLSFCGGGDIRLEAELIEAGMDDLGEPWETTHLPRHET